MLRGCCLLNSVSAKLCSGIHDQVPQPAEPAPSIQGPVDRHLVRRLQRLGTRRCLQGTKSAVCDIPLIQGQRAIIGETAVESRTWYVGIQGDQASMCCRCARVVNARPSVGL